MTKQSRWDKKREELRRRIIETSIHLFQTQGFQETPMEQIAEKCDIARGTLYNHFPNKESILQTYLNDSRQDSEPEILALLAAEGTTRSRLLTALMKISEWSEKNREILRMHTSFRLNGLFSKGGYSTQNLYITLWRILKLGQDRGELRRDMTADSLAKYLNALCTTCFLEWLSGEKPQLGEKEMAELLDLFLSGAMKHPEGGELHELC